MSALIGLISFLGLIGGILVFTAYSILATNNKCYPIKNKSDIFIGIIMPAISVILIVASITGILTESEESQKSFYNNIKDYVNNDGYTVWINGAEVDLQHITIEDYPSYNISIEEEIKEIHIVTNK